MFSLFICIHKSGNILFCILMTLKLLIWISICWIWFCCATDQWSQWGSTPLPRISKISWMVWRLPSSIFEWPYFLFERNVVVFHFLYFRLLFYLILCCVIICVQILLKNIIVIIKVVEITLEFFMLLEFHKN